MASVEHKGGLTDAHKTIGIYRRLAEEARGAYLRISDRKRIEASFALVAMVKECHFRDGRPRHDGCCCCDWIVDHNL